jgi:hypothetical protein
MIFETSKLKRLRPTAEGHKLIDTRRSLAFLGRPKASINQIPFFIFPAHGAHRFPQLFVRAVRLLLHRSHGG